MKLLMCYGNRCHTRCGVVEEQRAVPDVSGERCQPKAERHVSYVGGVERGAYISSSTALHNPCSACSKCSDCGEMRVVCVVLVAHVAGIVCVSTEEYCVRTLGDMAAARSERVNLRLCVAP